MTTSIALATPNLPARVAATGDNLWQSLTAAASAPLDLVIRLWLAQGFLLSGILKLNDWNTAILLATYEYPVSWMSPAQAAVTGVCVELIGGLLLAIGLATRPAALALAALTLVVQSEYLQLNSHLYTIVLLLGLALSGARGLSLDQLLGKGLGDSAVPGGLFLQRLFARIDPVAVPLVSLAQRLIVAAVLLGRQLVHRLYHGRTRRSPAWDCGYVFQGPRAQDTAEGFSQPIRRIFEPMFRMERHFPTLRDEKPYYSVKVEDHFWHWLYLPLARAAEWVSRLIIRLQGGRIAIYLLYSFLTLIILLLVARP